MGDDTAAMCVARGVFGTSGADPRQVYDFFLLGLALCPQVNPAIARELVDACIRLYPPHYDSRAGG
jgi:BarA-like signal transduction histidine kinase